MKKRILSSLLMGALFVASMSTFTSCKDYDDDINNLQAQIDKAALASDVTTLKTTVDAAASNANSALTKAEAAATQAGANQTAIAAVKATADKAATDVATVIASAAKAQTTADASATAAAAAQKTADQAVVAAAAAQKDATSALTQLGTLEKTYVTSKALSSALDSVKANINAAVDTVAFNALKKQVASFKGSIDAIYSAITDVSLVGTFGTNAQGVATLTSDYELNFETGTIPNTYTFGKAEKDDLSKTHSGTPAKTYTKDGTINFPSALVIRVNPTNATPTADMIKLIDSKGNDLNKLIKVVDVTKFNTLLTRGTSETGLWTVSLQLQDGVKAADVPQLNNGAHVLYAVAINNTLDKDSSRYAVSTYDLTVGATTSYTGANSLAKVKVKSETSMSDWKLISATKAREERTANADIPATSGENIFVSFENLPNVDRFYIVRDDSHAGESDASEINAWNSYNYTGLGQVVEVKNGTGQGQITVTIPSDKKTGDEVGFRIFAVNYDGTLVDADGSAFYVYVGEDANATTVTGNIYATTNFPNSGWLPITGTLVAHEATGTDLPATVTFKVNNVDETANVEYSTDGKTAISAASLAATDHTKIKYVKFTMTKDIQTWTDAAAGTFQLTSTNAKGITENTINVNLTKVMPDEAYTKKLMNYSWKAGQLVDGVYTAYLYPESTTGAKDDTWTASSPYGYKNLNQAINGLTTNFTVSIANAALKANNGKNYYTDYLKATTTPWTIDVNNAKDAANVVLIDNTTKHVTTIGYDYGIVSSKSTTDHYIVNVETVNTVFACPLSTTAQTYAWKQYEVTPASGNTPAVMGDVNVLTYGEATTKVTNILDYLIGTNAFDNTVFGGKLSSIYTKYVSISAKLYSISNGNEDYFTTTVNNGVITFTKQSNNTNPAADVPSILEITMTDAFGHANVYKMPFTVKRAQ